MEKGRICAVWMHGLLLVVAAWLSACGGGGSEGGEPSIPSNNRPTAIQFQLISHLLAPGQVLFLRATATFPDNTSREITQEAQWQTSKAAVATVGTAGEPGMAGVVTGVADGFADISVTLHGVTAVFRVQVGNLLQFIEFLVPDDLAIGVDGTFPLYAEGHYTDATREVTAQVQWTTSDPSIARFDTGAGKAGVVRGVAPGTVTVTASLEGVSRQMSLTILPIRSLDSGSTTRFPTTVVAAIDDSGRALAAWGFAYPTGDLSDLAFSRTIGTQVSTWAPVSPLRPTPPARGNTSSGLKLASNGAGRALAVWKDTEGLFAAAFTPEAGWTAAQQVAPFPTTGFEQQAWVSIDEQGNGQAVWLGSGLTPSLWSSQYAASSGRWSVPSELPGTPSATTTQALLKIAFNRVGGVTVLWSRRDDLLFTTMLFASRFVPGNHLGSGWQEAEPLGPWSLGSPVGLGLAMGDGGDAIMVWMDGDVQVQDVLARRFEPAAGWQAAQTVLAGTSRSPNSPMLAINGSGHAVLAWRNSRDVSVSASHFTPAAGWAAPRDMYRPNWLAAGDPTMLKAAMSEDGQAVIAWLVDDLQLLGRLVTATFAPATGWASPELHTFVGRSGSVGETDIAFNRSGQCVVIWLEGNASRFDIYVHTGLKFF